MYEKTRGLMDERVNERMEIRIRESAMPYHGGNGFKVTVGKQSIRLN